MASLSVLPIILLALCRCEAFQTTKTKRRFDSHHIDKNIYDKNKRTATHRSSALQDFEQNKTEDIKPTTTLSRRQAIKSSLMPVSSLLLLTSPTARKSLAAEILQDSFIEKTSTVNCLSDLPQLDTTKFVRLYLCRHGETENNRLKLIQGVRIDAPINETGQRQASKLGKALSKSYNPPELFLHSPLVRAKQTAEIAANEFTSAAPTTRMLQSLQEIDFGQVAEGAPVEEMRAGMVATYTAWGLGNLDARMVESGESGREVLSRIDYALDSLVEAASMTKTGSVAAVAHSVYLRLLLSSVQSTPILQASRVVQNNCCINVLDFPRKTKVLLNKGSGASLAATKAIPFLFYGSAGKSMPVAKLGRVVRINENRHLEALA